MLLIELLIGYLLAWRWIRIEIIIDVETVNVITAHDVGSHLAGIVSTLLQAWVHDDKVIIIEAKLRMLLHDALRGELTEGGGTMLGTIRIDPRMQLLLWHCSTIHCRGSQ